MKKILAAFALFALSGAASANDLPSYPFIHVSGSAFLRAMPDIGELNFEIATYEADPEAAWKIVDGRRNEIRALLAEQGIPEEDISVQDIQRRMRKPDGDGPPQPAVTMASVQVIVRDLSKWGPIVQPIMHLQNIDAIGVAFSRSDAQQLEADLVKEALADARRQAMNIARGAGRGLGPVNGVSLQPLKNLSNSFGLASENYERVSRPKRDGVDYSLVAAMELRQIVNVLYRFK